MQKSCRKEAFLGRFCLKPRVWRPWFCKNAPFSGFKAIFKTKNEPFFRHGLCGGSQTPIFVVLCGFETLRSAVWRPFPQKTCRTEAIFGICWPLTPSWVAKKRLKRGFYRYFCIFWLSCHELNLRNLVISRVLHTFVQIRLCLAWPGRPGFCPKMLKTLVLQIFCESVLHIRLPLARKSRCFLGFGHFVYNGLCLDWLGRSCFCPKKCL